MKPNTAADLPVDPFTLFDEWYRSARESEGIRYSHAMHLSTVSELGWPEGRMVLLLEHDHRGFCFFTDSRSDKARSLAANPRAALTLYWEPLERQIRITGPVSLTSDREADAFFSGRPRRSQITAWASMQSQPLKSRQHLDERVRELEDEFGDAAPLSRPPHWKGYRVVPERIEFWEAASARLHVRFVYTRAGGGWERELLYP